MAASYLANREHAKYGVTYTAKVHPVTASISVKFWKIKEDIGISQRTTSHFRISYRSRNICLDCGSFINLNVNRLKN